MQRIRLKSSFIEFLNQQSVSLNHDLGIGGFHRDDDVIKLLVFTNPQKLKGRLYHTERGIPIAAHDAVGKGPVIGSDSHGCTVLFTDFYQRQKPLTNPFQLLSIGSIGVVDDLKFLFVGIVAWVDSDFLDDFGCQFSSIRREMNISY